MKHIILLLAVVCAVASFVFPYAAKAAASGTHWTAQVCTAVGELCHRSLTFAVAAILPNEKPRPDRMVGAK